MYHQKKWKKQIGKDVNIWGKLLDTDEGIKRRKALAIETYNKLKNILENKSNINETKNKNSKNLHRKYLSIQLRIVDLDQTTGGSHLSLIFREHENLSHLSIFQLISINLH